MTETPPDDRILTPREARELCHIAASTLNRLAREGALPDDTIIRNGHGHRRYRESGIRQFMAERTAGLS